MQYKGYDIIARAIWRPVGHFKCQFAVYRTSASGANEVVYRGVIASPDYTDPRLAEAHATRAAQGWIDAQARKRSVHTDPQHHGEDSEVHSSIGIAYG